MWARIKAFYRRRRKLFNALPFIAVTIAGNLEWINEAQSQVLNEQINNILTAIGAIGTAITIHESRNEPPAHPPASDLLLRS